MLGGYRLGNGCSIAHGYAFSGMTELHDQSLPIVVNIGNFKYNGGFRFESTKIQQYADDYPDRFRLAPGDVLLVMTCQTAGGEILGISGRIPDDGRTYLHNQRLGKVVIHRPDDLNLGYLYYLFLSPAFNAHLVATASGAKILHTAPSRIESFTWNRPPLPVQRRIADILSAYDDLIENNTKRIKILEEMARSLYREWFVNFRFPGHEKVQLVESPIGKVPKGWTIRRIDEYGPVITGKTPSKADPSNFGSDIAFIKLPDMHGNVFCIKTSEMLSAKGAMTQSNKMLPSNAICVSCIGTAGIVCITSEPSHTNQQINSIVPAEPSAREYIFFIVQGLGDGLRALGANGATMVNVNKEKFASIKTLWPEPSVVHQFHQKAGPCFEQILKLQQVNARLVQTRDILLPRLISGDIDVSRLPAPRA
ncbi:restriction endonuclease subunit S [Sorangium sp. So ce726]|uniref:restriction endonuclease subunit S n=1 Tax=Sorangium sp. So ce726 TaxID=3133319 RepID=UPI003F5FBFF4